ncbi:hypothetical protein [Lactiplantibacillus xiangfangensis]|uniref:hypothetical protein n=1 Tax=Lactiplantibacillus xiangfangensis TaxID=942150 RepID=UPI00384EA123
MAKSKRQQIWQFFTFLMDKTKRETHVGYLCRVTALDGKTCTVQPLDLKNGDKRALILSVRVPKHCRDDIKVGAAVAVSFFDRDVSASDVGATSDVENGSDRVHSLNDAYVTGVF